MKECGLLTGLTLNDRMDEQRDLTWRYTRAFGDQVRDCREILTVLESGEQVRNMRFDLLNRVIGQYWFRRSRRNGGHAETEQIPSDVIQKQERCHDERDGSPPAEQKCCGGHAPKMFVNARLAQATLDRLGESYDKSTDVLVKRNILRLCFDTAILANHHYSPLS